MGNTQKIELKGKRSLEGMRNAGKNVGEILDKIGQQIKPGILLHLIGKRLPEMKQTVRD